MICVVVDLYLCKGAEILTRFLCPELRVKKFRPLKLNHEVLINSFGFALVVGKRQLRGERLRNRLVSSLTQNYGLDLSLLNNSNFLVLRLLTMRFKDDLNYVERFLPLNL